MFKNSLAILTICASTTLALPQHFAFASDLPLCAQSDSDPDGDGFGWENGQSCTVNNELTPPQFTDLATGQAINFTLASWETKNLENRPIVCETYHWNSDEQTYFNSRLRDAGSAGTRVYYHNPLDTDGTVSEEQIFQSHLNNRVTSNTNFRTVKPWNVENGSYTGPAGFSRSPYVEVVSIAGGFENAVRTWLNNTQYTLCSAFPASGTFIPTGNLPECIDTAPFGDGYGWDGEGTCKILTDTTVGISECEAYFTAPVTECIDVFPVGDGWGWNGSYSCEVQTP